MSVALKKTLITAACLATALTTASSALALEKGDWIGRLGVSHISPDSSSDPVPGIPGSGVEADSSTSATFNIGYMVTDKLAIDVLAAWPFTHDINGTGTIAGLGKIGETKQLPPTVSLQYHFSPKANFRPYVGVGVNWTHFFDTEAKGALTGASLRLHSSVGIAGQLGADYDLNKDWFMYGDVRYMDINTDASLNGGPEFEVEIDPWIFAVGIGTTF